MLKNKFLIIIFTTLLVAIIGINQFLLKEKSTLSSDFSDKAVVYTISSSGEYPRFLKAIIDPEDVKPGDMQRMLIEVESPDGIEQVKAEIEHDEGIDELILNLKDGDEKYGQWVGIWEVHSTHSETYRTTFIAKDKTGKTNKIVLAWTDACVPPRGGDWTLDGNCSISGVNGVDNGNFTIDGGYTLTINADGVFARNPGQTITITNGSIVIASGGELKETNLWMIDADADGYSAGATQYAQDTAPTSGRRRYLVTGSGTDCNESDATKYQNLTAYTDGDGDGYGVGTSQQLCSGASLPAGYADNATDCCDSDNLAHPGQTTYYTSLNNCSSWDYDCNEVISKSNCSGYGQGGWRDDCTQGACVIGGPYSTGYTCDAVVRNCGQSNFYYSRGQACTIFDPWTELCPASGYYMCPLLGYWTCACK